MGIASLQVRNVLQTSVIDAYFAPAPLDSVLIGGKSKSIVTTGKTFIKTGLTYKFVPLPLSRFPIQEVRVPAKARFLAPNGIGGSKFIRKDYALAAQVKVKRGGAFKTIRGRKGFKGFLQKAGGNHRRGIYERQQRATWIVEPTTRAPIKPLFGPSLSQMARTQFNKNSKVRTVIDNVGNTILQSLRL